MHGPKKRGPKPKSFVMKVQFLMLGLIHANESFNLKLYFVHTVTRLKSSHPNYTKRVYIVK